MQKEIHLTQSLDDFDPNNLPVFNLSTWKFLARIEHPAIFGGLDVNDLASKDPEKVGAVADRLAEWVLFHAADIDDLEDLSSDEGLRKKWTNRVLAKIPASILPRVLLQLDEQISLATSKAVVPKASDSGKK